MDITLSIRWSNSFLRRWVLGSNQLTPCSGPYCNAGLSNRIFSLQHSEMIVALLHLGAEERVNFVVMVELF